MQDRFKFRVWDKENNKMFTPPRHFNYSNVNGTIVCIESFCQYDGFYQKRIIKEFNDAILMQCTGLKDKNGRLIYEGDIVKFRNTDNKYYIGTIKYTDEDALFCLNYRNENNRDDWDYVSRYKLEVIGNIYEDIHLIENSHSIYENSELSEGHND